MADTTIGGGTPVMTQEQILEQTKAENAKQQEFSFKMQQLQRQQNQEQEAMTALSNVIKNGHDARMNQIGNMKG